MSQNRAHGGMPHIDYLLAAGWTSQRIRGRVCWHRGQRAAGDRYRPEGDAYLIARAEAAAAGCTLWPGDAGWPQGVT